MLHLFVHQINYDSISWIWRLFKLVFCLQKPCQQPTFSSDWHFNQWFFKRIQTLVASIFIRYLLASSDCIAKSPSRRVVCHLLLTACRLPNNPPISLPPTAYQRSWQVRKPLFEKSRTRSIFNQSYQLPAKPSLSKFSGISADLIAVMRLLQCSIDRNGSAESIDIQYHIWQQRCSRDGYWCFNRPVPEAANRGVKVRPLLDDLNTNWTMTNSYLPLLRIPEISKCDWLTPKVRNFTPPFW